MKAEVKRLIQNLGELAAAVDELDKLKSIEQAENEAKARVAVLQREADRMISEAKDQTSAAQIKAQEIVDAAKVKSDEMYVEAIAAVNNMRSQAAAELKAAKADAGLIMSNANDMLNKSNAAAASAESRRKDAEKELGELEKRMAKVRALIAPLAG